MVCFVPITKEEKKCVKIVNVNTLNLVNHTNSANDSFDKRIAPQTIYNCLHEMNEASQADLAMVQSVPCSACSYSYSCSCSYPSSSPWTKSKSHSYTGTQTHTQTVKNHIKSTQWKDGANSLVMEVQT